ncbi:MAG: MFS transporter [Solirubrobacteraceae bacterium]|nr:MAG: MFS transporter [Solirubrobacterales bacterium]
MESGSLLGDLSRRTGAGLARIARWFAGRVEARVVEAVGGPARARVILLFGGVLALATADAATVGAVAAQLEPDLHISNTQVGLLNSVSLIVGAGAAIPIGLLVDRITRVRVLAFSIVLWSIATAASGLAGSYSSLLLTRLVLGAISATAGPAIASLTGDYFPASERVRVYGYVLVGEIAGTAVGFLFSGTLAGLFSWRVAFFALALPGFWLARELWRTVPEPQRGGMSRLERGAEELVPAPRGGARGPIGAGIEEGDPVREDELAKLAVEARGIKANREQILDEHAASMPLRRVVPYVLRIRTNVLLITSSALGYFFLAGLSTFAIVFVRAHYGVGQATATGVLGLLVLGALAGTLVSGPLTDLLLRHGILNARIWVPAIAYIVAAVLLTIGIAGTHLTPAIWFDMAGAAALAAANPPLDAARLDIMPAGLWGRAESVRTVLRTTAQAIAPLLFGAVADLVAGFTPRQAPIGTKPDPSGIAPGVGTGLEISFLLMLIALAAGGIVLLKARNTYPQDVATAVASTEVQEMPPTRVMPASSGRAPP